MPTTETRVAFCLYGFDIDPDEITAITGITPSRIRRIGDRTGITGRRRNTNEWILSSRLDTSARVQQHLDDVLGQLEVQWKEVAALCQRFSGLIDCYVRVYDDLPGIYFDTKAMAHICDLGAAISIDQYLFVNADEEH